MNFDKAQRIFGIPAKDMDEESLKQRFRVLAKQLHGDVSGGGDTAMTELNLAYQRCLEFVGAGGPAGERTGTHEFLRTASGARRTKINRDHFDTMKDNLQDLHDKARRTSGAGAAYKAEAYSMEAEMLKTGLEFDTTEPRAIAIIAIITDFTRKPGQQHQKDFQVTKAMYDKIADGHGRVFIQLKSDGKIHIRVVT